MRQCNMPTLLQIMVCRLFGTKPLSEPILPFCQLGPKEHASVKFRLKFNSFHSRKCTWKIVVCWSVNRSICSPLRAEFWKHFFKNKLEFHIDLISVYILMAFDLVITHQVNRQLMKCFCEYFREHDDVIKWKHFPRYWPFVRGIHRSTVNSRTKASDAELWCFLWSASE